MTTLKTLFLIGLMALGGCEKQYNRTQVKRLCETAYAAGQMDVEFAHNTTGYVIANPKEYTDFVFGKDND